jgi:hypothetical protein
MSLEAYMKKYGVECKKCGVVFQEGVSNIEFFSIDHIHEKVDGGCNGSHNKQLLCWGCHRIKNKISVLKRNELGRAISMVEAFEINERFLKNKFMFVKDEVLNENMKMKRVKRVILGI